MLARRTVTSVLREIDREGDRTPDEALEYVKGELSGYLARARPLYEEFQGRMRASSDVIVDGTLSIDDMSSRRYVSRRRRVSQANYRSGPPSPVVTQTFSALWMG